MNKMYDLAVIGGGINGFGIAADAQGRGLSVFLCEQDDLANATSSASSKLIHGGLRYLEQYDFGLVKESLQERTILHQSAPYLVRPLPFIIPCNKKGRSSWLIRLGLFLYDILAAHSGFAKSSAIKFSPCTKNNPLKDFLKKGFIYTDCQTDDARLVIVNALRAKQLGADIRPRTKCIKAEQTQGHWQLTLQDRLTEQCYVIKAQVLVNATGPWLIQTLENTLKLPASHNLKLVKGSHIVLPKLYEGDNAYLLQHKDKRVVFVIPYQENFTVIGTTDEDFKGDPKGVTISQHEINYLCQIVNQYFKKSISENEIIYTWSGVRPLLSCKNKNNAALRRGYHIELLHSSLQDAPLLNIYGGKLTTYRHLAEKAVDKIAYFFSHCGPAWTKESKLPGFKDNFSLEEEYPWLPKALANRYQKQYGALASSFLQDATSVADLGEDFGHGLYEKEVRYLINTEWALTAEDILFRRTKLGLFFNIEQGQNLDLWLKNHGRVDLFFSTRVI